MILVSACLLGKNCKYNGGNNLCRKVIEFLKDKEYTEICPECMGGLSTPRAPSEIKDGKVFSENGTDVTREFLKGAEESLKLAKEYGVSMAILKQGSPSCGCGRIYDGSFSGNKIKGMGITAKLLKNHGLEILTEDDFVD